MKARLVIRPGLALAAVVGGAVLSVFAFIPGSLPVAHGQTAETPNVLPGTLPISVGQTTAPISGFPAPTPGTQVCLNGQILPASMACQIFPVTGGVPFVYSQPECVVSPSGCSQSTYTVNQPTMAGAGSSPSVAEYCTDPSSGEQIWAPAGSPPLASGWRCP
jgi:hypothetical protein